MDLLLTASIILEIVSAFFGLLIFYHKKKGWGLCVTLTFVLYVFYDAAREYSLNVSENVLSLVFFIASVSILWVFYSIYREKR